MSTLSVTKTKDNETLTAVISGRIDTSTSPELDMASKSWYLISQRWSISLPPDFACCFLCTRQWQQPTVSLSSASLPKWWSRYLR